MKKQKEKLNERLQLLLIKSQKRFKELGKLANDIYNDKDKITDEDIKNITFELECCLTRIFQIKMYIKKCNLFLKHEKRNVVMKKIPPVIYKKYHEKIFGKNEN